MTYIELLKSVDQCSGMGNISVNTVKKLMREFFESNVCIPKGANRHPSSNVLHQAIEGTEIQGWNHTRNEWEDDTSWFIDKNDLDYPTKYRIKPSEPVLEWQWAYNRNFGDAALSEYMTEEEAKDKCVGYNAVKIDFTQRERK